MFFLWFLIITPLYNISLWLQTLTYLRQTGISIGGDTEITTDPQLPQVATRSAGQYLPTHFVSSDVRSKQIRRMQIKRLKKGIKRTMAMANRQR